MSQHELLTRVLVGRLDDGGTQARDAAVHAPVLFVDNPWSKAFGRRLQGYDKQLAVFCHGPQEGFETLTMQGRFRGTTVPLHRVSRVALPARAAEAGWEGQPITPSARDHLAARTVFEIELLDQADEKRDFRSANLAWLGGIPGLEGIPWRQSDFADPGFRRAFAGRVMASRFAEFRSLQVLPVDKEEADETGLPRSWVQGRFTLLKPSFAPPSGLARLRFAAPDGSPASWVDLVSLLRLAGLLDDDGWMGVPPGDWYRVRCDIDLKIDEGLDWD